jgi:hypothetical protein
MLSGLRLPFRFDVLRLQADLARVPPADWSPHYNDRDYGGVWRGVALRSATGSSSHLLAAHTDAAFADTPLLARCPYIREVLSVFPCPLKSVRLLALAPGSYIREHTDNALDYEDGEIRIHIPFKTSPAVEFYVAGERLLMEEGGCYYVNVNLPHRVNNRGTAERIHLVIDAQVNDWVHDLFRRGAAEGWHIPRAPLPGASLDDFRRYALRDEGLLRELRAIPDRQTFLDAVIRSGRERGFEFHEGDLDAAFRAPVADPEGSPPPGWIPTRFSAGDGRPVAEWTWLGETRLTAAFFEEEIRECSRTPFGALFRRMAPLPPAALAPRGFVFHMSRCGSSLVSRLLSSSPRVAMISEAPPIDEVLRSENIEWLRWMLAALGRARTQAETRLIVKLDAWHILSLPLLLRAFPGTPWVFLLRDPLEVAVSQLRRPSMLFSRQQPTAGREEWCVALLETVLQGACGAAAFPHGLFVDYRQLPEAVPDVIAKHFAIDLSPEESARMRDLSQFDAKAPGIFFQPDSAEKGREASRNLRTLVDARLRPLYDRCLTNAQQPVVSPSPAIQTATEPETLETPPSS